MSDDPTLDEFVDSEKTIKGSDDNSVQEIEESVQEMFGIGRIPREWDIQPLANLAEIVAGNSPPSSTYNEDGNGLPFFQGNSEFGHFHPEADTWCSEPRKIAETNDILISIRAPVGDLNIADQRCCIGRGLTALRQNDTSGLYLYYHLAERKNWLSRLATGSTFKSITKGDLQNLDIPCPPLPEQRKIATILHTVDQAIQKTEEIIEQVRTIKQGILQDLMSGAGSDRQFEKKRVGPRVVSLPKDWEVVQIGDALESNIIFQQQDGNHGSDYPRKDEFVDEGVPYLSAEMLSEGEVDFSQAKYLTEERANQLRIGFAKDGDVLLAHNATVGPTGLLETTLDFVIIGTSLTYYRCNPNELNSQYMTYFFQSGTFQKQLQDVMRQSTRNQVPITRQRNLHLILPPIQQQREISNQIDTVNEKLQTENQYREGLKRLKRGLMQDLLSGEVRTTDVNIDIPEEVAKYG